MSKLLAKTLSQGEVDTLVARLVADFRHLDGLERIILFGSAVGTMTEASDIDLILVFETRAQALLARKRVYGMRTPPIWPADLICVDKEYFAQQSRLGGVCMVADQEGRTVYEKGIG